MGEGTPGAGEIISESDGGGHPERVSEGLGSLLQDQGDGGSSISWYEHGLKNTGQTSALSPEASPAQLRGGLWSGAASAQMQ